MQPELDGVTHWLIRHAAGLAPDSLSSRLEEEWLADRNFGYFSLRSGTLFLILGLHAAVFCGLIATLSHARGLVAPTISESGQLKTSPPEIEIRVLLSEE